MPLPLCARALLLAAILLIPAFQVSAKQQQPVFEGANLLPPSTLLYAEVIDPSSLIETIETHPLMARIEQLDEFKQMLASPEAAAMLLGKAVLEQRLGGSLIQSLQSSLSGGICIGFDSESSGSVLIGKTNDEPALRRLLGSVLALIKTHAENDGREPPFTVDDFHGAKVADFGDFVIARHGSWLIVSNKPQLTASVIKRINGNEDPALPESGWFQSAAVLTADSGVRDVRAFADLNTIRKISDNREIFAGRTDEPAAELLFGGILDTLKQAPFAVATLTLDEKLSLKVATPFQQDWANEHREFFFGEQLSGAAPNLLPVKNGIASLSSYRDIAGWWLSKEDLYEENVIAGLAQADSQLSTIFSGMDFGQEVLGALKPGVQIFVTENQYRTDHQPDIKLPAFALVGKLKDPQRIQPRLKIAFQSAIGIVNLNLGMNGQPQLTIDTETIGEGKLSWGSYYVEDEEPGGLTLFNFTPALGFQGDYLVLSSTKELAQELIELAAEHPDGVSVAGRRDCNTLLHIDGEELQEILHSNMEAMITSNMLEKGHGRQAAERENGILRSVVGLIDQATAEYLVDDNEMRLDIQLGFRTEQR